MKNKLTVYQPSFASCWGTVAIFGVLYLVILLLYREKTLFLEFWIGMFSLMGIFIVPQFLIIMLVRQCTRFDGTKGIITVRRWFYQYEIPFQEASLEIISQPLSSMKGIDPLRNLIVFILDNLLAKVTSMGSSMWKLRVSDRKKGFIVTESISSSRIRRLESTLQNLFLSK